MEPTVLLLSIVLALVFIVALAMRVQSVAAVRHLQTQLLQQVQKHENLEHSHTTLLATHTALDKRATLLQAELTYSTQKYEDSVQSQAQVKQQFEQIANVILSQKADKFDMQHRQGIREILSPLQDQIKAFEQKIDSSTKENIARHSSLKTQIYHLAELNEKITQEAANLTKALKGDNKVQGAWGELILESILDKSGLEKGREYFIQETFSVAGSKSQRPDVVVALPDGKRMIIDSKVSLKSYDAIVSADSKAQSALASKAHFRSIKQHIDGLSAKNYHDLYQIESPDFVLMFIPIDTAFAAAVATDPDIYGYAFDKNIVIVTPATLLATLKTVDTLWNNDKQQQNALEIATEAGKMYDKLTLLADDLLSIGKRIDQTKDAYHESMKKLTTGRGNLVGRAQKIKALGAKTSKQLNEGLISKLENE